MAGDIAGLIKHPELVGRLVVVSAPFMRSGFYPDILAQQRQVTAEAAEAVKQTPMFQLYASKAPRPEDWRASKRPRSSSPAMQISSRPRTPWSSSDFSAVASATGDGMARDAGSRGSPSCRV